MRPITLALVATGVLLSGCASQIQSFSAHDAQTQGCVVLMHGLSRSSRAMQPMAEGLQEAGFSTINVDYPSRSEGIETLAPQVIGTGVEGCNALGFAQVHFVTHSIGGILLRYEQARAPIEGLGRVVMLGPPNQGSELVDIGRYIPLFPAIASPAGEQLGTDPESVPSLLGPVDFELGVIAGTKTANPFVSLFLPNPDDGKVSVERTKVDGMQDFIVVERSHAFMMRTPSVIEYTANFLKHGCFDGQPPVQGCVVKSAGPPGHD